MSMVAHPTSDSQRLALLQQATATGDQTSGQNYLPVETRHALAEMLVAFSAANQTVTATEAAFSLPQQKTEDAFAALVTQVQRIWNDARARVRFDQENPALLTYAHLPQSSPARRPVSRSDWLESAERLRQGAAQAQAAGFAPLAHTESLPDLIAAARRELQELLSARTARSAAQSERARQRREIARLSRRLAADLRYALRDLPPTYQRQIMRSYGVIFHEKSNSQPVPPPLPGPALKTTGAVVGWQLQPEPVAQQ